tara:strand:+ start:564 stop:764 length:201 start_codon:yes stop_codon:yes gene_type:complete
MSRRFLFLARGIVSDEDWEHIEDSMEAAHDKGFRFRAMSTDTYGSTGMGRVKTQIVVLMEREDADG